MIKGDIILQADIFYEIIKIKKISETLVKCIVINIVHKSLPQRIRTKKHVTIQLRKGFFFNITKCLKSKRYNEHTINNFCGMLPYKNFEHLIQGQIIFLIKECGES